MTEMKPTFFKWAEGVLIKALALALLNNDQIKSERDYWKTLAGRHAETIKKLRVTIDLMGGEK